MRTGSGIFTKTAPKCSTIIYYFDKEYGTRALRHVIITVDVFSFKNHEMKWYSSEFKEYPT